MTLTNIRAIAAIILSDMLKGNGSLTNHLSKHKTSKEYPLLQEICFGSCRWFHLLEFELSLLLQRPIKKKDSDIKCLLIIGIYQLKELGVADYAAINETVSAIDELHKPWAKALVNAVLRNYQRQSEMIKASVAKAGLSIRMSHPKWIVEKLAAQQSDDLETILSNNNQRPPMTLRANNRKSTTSKILKSLEEANIQATPGQIAKSAITLAKPMSVENLPGFNEGLLSVQDEASQLVPDLLQLEPGLRVLDACAAPGGKTCHILESERSLSELVALDISSERLKKIKENLFRLHFKATLLIADAANTNSWWDGIGFDRILLDAPCSATGVIRRHPDIKLLREESDLISLQHSQKSLLETLWGCLKPGGLLLYTTCSILKEENQDVISAFLESTDNAKYEGIAADWGVECENGRQLLPGPNNGSDGFFFSLLVKS